MVQVGKEEIRVDPPLILDDFEIPVREREDFGFVLKDVAELEIDVFHGFLILNHPSEKGY